MSVANARKGAVQAGEHCNCTRKSVSPAGWGKASPAPFQSRRPANLAVQRVRNPAPIGCAVTLVMMTRKSTDVGHGDKARRYVLIWPDQRIGSDTRASRRRRERECVTSFSLLTASRQTVELNLSRDRDDSSKMTQYGAIAYG